MLRTCSCCGGTGVDLLDGGQCDECNGTGMIMTGEGDFDFGGNVNEGYDRIWTDADGTSYYGYDDEDGTTAWYDRNGYLDSISETPEDYEQTANEEGWLF